MANRYWVGGSGTWNTTSTTNWSTSSGGAGGASVPTAADSVFFDSASSHNVTMTGALTCLDFNVSGAAKGFSTGTSPSLTVSGSMILTAGSSWDIAGNLTFNASTTGKTITTNGVSLNTGVGQVIFNNASGGWTLGSALTVSTSGGIAISAGTLSTSASNYAITTNFYISVQGGTLQLNGSTVSLTSTSATSFYYFSGTFNAGTSQINVTSNSSFAGGGRTFYNVSFTANNTGLSTYSVISGQNTFNNLTIAPRTAAVGIGRVAFADSQTVNGTFTLAGNADATYRMLVSSDTFGTARTLTCAAVSLTDVDFQDIIGAGAASWTGTRIGNARGNSGITFATAKTVYWNSAAGGNWGSASWATTSGGAPSSNNFPLPQDTAIIGNTGLNAGATITINSSYFFGNVDMSTRTSAMVMSNTNATNSIIGNWINGSGTTLSFSGTFPVFQFSGRSSQTVTAANKTFGAPFIINSPGGTLTLQDNLAVSPSAGATSVTLTNGTLNLNGKTLFVQNGTTGFTTGSGTKNLTFNGGTLSIAVSGATAFYNQVPTGFTTTAGTGTGAITLTSASSKSFWGFNSTFNCALDQGGAGALTITGANTFGDITNTYGATGATTITFPAGTTTTVSNFTASGTVGKLLTINSSSAGTQATLSKTSGTVNANYLNIKDSAATGGATWLATNSINGGNNTGWIFLLAGGNMFLMFS